MEAENGGPFAQQLQALIDVLDEETLAFLSCRTRRYLSGEVEMPLLWRQEIEDRPLDDFRTFPWLEQEAADGSTSVVPLSRAGLDNVGRCVKKLGFDKKKVMEHPQMLVLSKQAATGMTPKKKYEVERFTMAIKRMKEAQREQVDLFFDIGCGGGYLTMVTSLVAGVKMIGVGYGRDFTNNERRKIRSALIAKDNVSQPQETPEFVALVIENSTTLSELRRKANLTDSQPIGLCGLHCCGQLSVNILRMFVADPHCRVLSLIGCCYGRLGVCGHEMDFPLSKRAKSMPILAKFNVSVFRIACENVMYCERETSESFTATLKLLFFRLVSEMILDEELKCEYKCKKKVKKLPQLFSTYFLQLTQGLEVVAGESQLRDISEAELNEQFENVYTAENIRRIAGMLAIKNSMASMIESVIILDRMLYIEENVACKAEIQPIFDPGISPINMLMSITKI
jgi:hypothetical protein